MSCRQVWNDCENTSNNGTEEKIGFKDFGQWLEQGCTPGREIWQHAKVELTCLKSQQYRFDMGVDVSIGWGTITAFKRRETGEQWWGSRMGEWLK